MESPRVWTHRNGAFDLDGRTLVMGIVNVTPDSFSDGGDHFQSADAIDSALRMAADGADILDIGGESTRPGHEIIGVNEEIARVIPVIEALRQTASDMPPISIDTWKADVARAAVRAGASIINDVWGFQRDPKIAQVAAETGCGVVLMHNRETIDASVDIVQDMLLFLETSAAIALEAGVTREKIALDPGIGFGKTLEQNYQALAALPRLVAMGYPILLGVSRKSFIGRLFDPEPAPKARVPGSLAAAVAGVLAGVDIIRVHDIAPTIQAMRVADAIRRGRP